LTISSLTDSSLLMFHPLRIQRIAPEAAGAVAISLAIPTALRETFAFRPGQFLTLRHTIDGVEQRRSYSICSPMGALGRGEIQIGIKPVEGGVFSNWAAKQLQTGDTLDVMPPEGRFIPAAFRRVGTPAPSSKSRTEPTEPTSPAIHRVGFAAGSGITPILSIIATTLSEEHDSRFTLVYSNQRVGSILFHEALQDLKDRYPSRLTLVHLLSRQPQEVALLHGRLDPAKVQALLATVLPAQTIDEAFICGPEGMIDVCEQALRAAGLQPEQIHTERFFAVAPGLRSAIKSEAAPAIEEKPKGTNALKTHRLQVVQDGKTHSFDCSPQDRVLDVALQGGLDLPWSCKGGVCCTCRARVLKGRVHMEKNYTLQADEVAQGFVLTCQTTLLTPEVLVSYDER
jgi:ring-1,2-phenylacetyl-CoA epoxidase subunit PaaE